MSRLVIMWPKSPSVSTRKEVIFESRAAASMAGISERSHSLARRSACRFCRLACRCFYLPTSITAYPLYSVRELRTGG